MNRNTIFYFILSIILICTIIGCHDEKSVYETGQKMISLITTDEGNEIEMVVDPAKQNRITLQAQIDQPSAFGIVVGVEAKSNLIEEYNKKHQTHYLELPPSAYSIEVAEFIFPKYTNVSSHVNISLTSTGMQDDITYLLPIQMILVSGDENASIDPAQDVIYLVVSRLPPPKLIHLEDVELTTEIGPDKKNWFAAYATNSEGGHTFTIEEAAEQSQMMDFVLLKHGANLRLHPSIIGWQHGGDYMRYVLPYIKGFEKLTMTTNMNKLYTTSLFNEINTTEELINKIAELTKTDKYNFDAADRMTSHNLQSQISGEDRVLIQGWGPRIGQNEQYSLLYIKEVTSLPGGEYTIKFDIKYVEHDIRSEMANVSGQNVVIDNPGYDPSNEIMEYKGVELTTEIGTSKKNWFSAYADKNMVAFTQEEARTKSQMMDFTVVIDKPDDIKLYSPYIGVKDANYKDRIASYTQGFSKLTYLMMGGWRGGSADATKPEHYDGVTDVNSLTDLIDFYSKTYAYPWGADRVLSDKLVKNAVGVIGWGHKVKFNNRFGIYIVRDIQPTTGGNYKVVLDIKVPKSDARTPNNDSTVTNTVN